MINKKYLFSAIIYVLCVLMLLDFVFTSVGVGRGFEEQNFLIVYFYTHAWGVFVTNLVFLWILPMILLVFGILFIEENEVYYFTFYDNEIFMGLGLLLGWKLCVVLTWIGVLF